MVYGEVWYQEEAPSDAGVDIVVYRQRTSPVANALQAPSMLLLTDLTVDADAIAGAFDTTCRYHIRRAGKNDGLAMEFIADPVSRLEEFRTFYDAFAQQKSIWLADMDWLVAACRSRQLALTVATRDGEPLVWHAYVMFENTAGLQYSCSCFRDRDRDYRARVARANRWLHWQDMLQLKERGITRYDWGGLFADESTA
ncbi:MAG TPA: GNAT family N-acetyltransferase, partial [Vicinamibacterales bacterium]